MYDSQFLPQNKNKNFFLTILTVYINRIVSASLSASLSHNSDLILQNWKITSHNSDFIQNFYRVHILHFIFPPQKYTQKSLWEINSITFLFFLKQASVQSVSVTYPCLVNISYLVRSSGLWDPVLPPPARGTSCPGPLSRCSTEPRTGRAGAHTASWCWRWRASGQCAVGPRAELPRSDRAQSSRSVTGTSSPHPHPWNHDSTATHPREKLRSQDTRNTHLISQHDKVTVHPKMNTSC